jgi:CubicO group peptidase (beta-lactamase class C family)
MEREITRRSFIRTASAAAVVGSIAAHAQTKPNAARPVGLTDRFVNNLPQLMEWANVPGVAVATFKDGKPAWSRGFGVAKAGETAPLTTETLFGAASLSKPVFAYGILRLRDEKLFDLDRPLWDYLPYEDLPAVDDAKKITARHVLSHSSGLQNWRFSRDDKLELAFKPGGGFQYSGEGFYYLQRVAEKVTGRGFEQFMQERVLKPLGMANSTYAWTPASAAKMSWGHNGRMQPRESFNAQRGKRMLEIADEWKKPVAEWRHEDVVRAQGLIDKNSSVFPNFLLPNTAGSLITSIDEYARFMSHLFAVASREMLAPQTRVNGGISWGLGVGLESFAGRSTFWHWGDNGTFKAFMMGEPTAGTGLVVFTNASNGHKLWHRIATEAMGPDHPAYYFFMT